MDKKNYYDEKYKREIISAGITKENRDRSNKEREQNNKKLYLTEIFDLEKPELSSNNMFLSPVGSGKSYLIEERLIPKDYVGTILYLTSNTALKDSLAPNNNKLRKMLAEEGKHKGFFTTQNKKTFGDVSYKVHVMTYHEFGVRLYSPHDEFTENIGLIFCDEIHSLPIFTQYGGNGELLLALKWLFQKHSNKTIFYFTATREGIDYLEIKSPGYTKNVKFFDYLKYPNIVRYVSRATYYISNVQQLKVHLRARKEWVDYNKAKGLAFARRIDTQEKIADIARGEGYIPIVLWSVNNEDKELSEEQKIVRDFILKTGNIPEPYNLLIINGSMQEGWNLFDENVEFAILDTLDETERVQALGRIRKDIDFLLLKSDNKQKTANSNHEVLVVDEKYLGVELDKQGREEVAKSLDVFNDRGIQLKWAAVKSNIIKSGYSVEDKLKLINGKRKSVSIITLK